MDNCIFCQIVAKKAAAKVIYENENVICFLPKAIEVYGHTLIVPKKHYADLYDIPSDALCELVKVAQILTLEYKQKINATGMNILHASGKDGQQSVFHFHFHLLPRFKDDGINTWPTLAKIEIDINKLWDKLRTT
jgi:histidine triad (HIT) family protein